MYTAVRDGLGHLASPLMLCFSTRALPAKVPNLPTYLAFGTHGALALAIGVLALVPHALEVT